MIRLNKKLSEILDSPTKKIECGNVFLRNNIPKSENESPRNKKPNYGNISFNVRSWCIKCDIDMIDKGIALDYPADGVFYECPTCNYKIVILPK